MKKLSIAIVLVLACVFAINTVPSLEHQRATVRQREQGITIISTQSYYDLGLCSYGSYKAMRNIGLGSEQGYACIGVFGGTFCTRIPMSQKQSKILSPRRFSQ